MLTSRQSANNDNLSFVTFTIFLTESPTLDGLAQLAIVPFGVSFPLEARGPGPFESTAQCGDPLHTFSQASFVCFILLCPSALRGNKDRSLKLFVHEQEIVSRSSASNCTA